MIIDLKLGGIKVSEIADIMQAELLTLSANAPDIEIERITGKMPEIIKNTLYIIDDDNSLAEMMAAAKNGAYAVLCTKAPSSLEKIPDSAVIVCDNIMNALERLAKQYSKRREYRTVALTGPKGKTRTGEFVYSVLEEMYKVHKATDKKTKDKNDALTLFEITNETDFLLVELKIHDKKDVKRLANIFDCDVGIITEMQSKIDTSANIDVLSGMKNGGEIAISAEDSGLELVCQTNAKSTTVSVKDDGAGLYADRIRKYKGRTVFDIRGEGVLIENVEIHFEGIENVYSALFAAFVGLKYGVPTENIRTGLKNYHSSELGVEIYTVGGITFITDSSSMYIESVYSAIDTLCDIAKLHKRSRKIALIGDIRDFGQETRILHEKMGEYIYNKKIDKLFTFGVAAEQIGVGARRAGMKDSDVSGNFELFSPQKSAEAVASVLREGDVLLVRMGRQNAMAEILKTLHERFEK